jgi:hypothetical protein
MSSRPSCGTSLHTWPVANDGFVLVAALGTAAKPRSALGHEKPDLRLDTGLAVHQAEVW